MNQRLMSIAWWVGVVAAASAAILFLFAEVAQPDCDDARLVLASSEHSRTARAVADMSAALVACEAKKRLFVTMDHVAIALCVAALLALSVALVFRLRINREFPERFVVRDNLRPRK